MNAAVNVKSAARPARTYQPSALPSVHALRLERTPMWELAKIFQRGTTPDPEALAGWEFRGINHLPLNVVPVAQIVGIKKFVKGFAWDERGKLMGYNIAAKMNALDGRWTVKGKRYGFYETITVDATSRDNAFLHAKLLDYGKADNGLNPMSLLRDYLVQVDPANPDLYLGYAYGAIGPLRLPLNFFILERFRVGLTDFATR